MFRSTEDGRIIHECYELRNKGKDIFKRQRFEDLEECKKACLDLIEEMVNSHILSYSTYASEFKPEIHQVSETVLFVYDPENKTMKGI